MKEPVRIEHEGGWTEIFDISPAQPGWRRATGFYDEEDDAAFLVDGLRPVVVWATTSQGVIGLTPGEALEDVLDMSTGEYFAHVSPDGAWLGGGDLYTGEEDWLSSVAGGARSLRRLAELRKQAKQKGFPQNAGCSG